jgi:hypothetical protein
VLAISVGVAKRHGSNAVDDDEICSIYYKYSQAGGNTGIYKRYYFLLRNEQQLRCCFSRLSLPKNQGRELARTPTGGSTNAENSGCSIDCCPQN